MKVKKRRKRCFAISWFVKDVIKKFSGQVYIDFALAYSVLHFNYGKSRHAGLFSHMELNVEIYSQMYYLANDTRRSCVSAKKNTEKNKKLDNRKGYKKKNKENNGKLLEGSVHNVDAGFDHL